MYNQALVIRLDLFLQFSTGLILMRFYSLFRVCLLGGIVFVPNSFASFGSFDEIKMVGADLSVIEQNEFN